MNHEVQELIQLLLPKWDQVLLCFEEMADEGTHGDTRLHLLFACDGWEQKGEWTVSEWKLERWEYIISAEEPSEIIKN